MAEIQFLNGNVHTPVVLVGDDPSNHEASDGVEAQDNVLIVPLGATVSVPRDTVSAEETKVEGGNAEQPPQG